MRAVTQTHYGPPGAVLKLREVDPPAVGDDQVLVRVVASSVNPDVWHAVTGRPYVLRAMGSGMRQPQQPIPGIDVAGRVEAVGRQVTRFRPGDEVFGETVGGFQWKNGGAYAEQVAVAASALAPKPPNVTFTQAASVPTAGLIALQNLDSVRAQASQRVLVNGAAGNVGALAVQIAKAWGAEVTAVDAAHKLEPLRDLGADRVLDYRETDWVRENVHYDLVFDVASTLRLADCQRILSPRGAYVLIGHDHFGAAQGRVLGSLPRMLGLAARSLFNPHLPRFGSPPPNEQLLATLTELLRESRITPFIDRVFPLGETVAALQYMQSGRAAGRIALQV